MFHWICPECGREIPPAVLECPACNPQVKDNTDAVVRSVAAEAAVPAEAPVLSSAPEAVTRPAIASVERSPENSEAALLALTERVRALQTRSAGARVPAAAVAPVAPAEEASAVPSSGGVALAEPVAAVQAAPLPAAAATSSGGVALADRVPLPAVAPPGVERAAGAPPVNGNAAGARPPVATAQVTTQDIDGAMLALAEQVRVAQERQVEPTDGGLAELATAIGTAEPVQLVLIPMAAAPEASKPVSSHEENKQLAMQQPLALLAAPVALAEPEPKALAEPAPAVWLKAVPPSKTYAGNEPVAQPTAPPAPRKDRDASQPPSGSWLRLAPLQDYRRAAGEQMRPCAPMPRILTQDSGPRMTLPGPMLPPELQERKNLKVLTSSREKRQAAVPGWAVSVIVMVLLLAAGIGLVSYVLPSSHTADAKAPAAQSVEPDTTVAVEPAAAASHPLSSFVEVTGIRFIIDLNRKSEVHYLVVNHSGTDLTNMTVYVTIKAANAKPGQAPLCRFSFPLPGLAAFESKEMVSSIEKISRAVELPDWHDLRADVQIAQ